MNMNHKVNIFVGVLGVIGTIAGAIIGVSFGKNNITIILPDGIEATLNSEQIEDIVYENEDLQELKAESNNIKKEIQNQLLTISKLEEENNNLKSQIEQLKTENENLQNQLKQKKEIDETKENSDTISVNSNAVDIFELQPFIGKTDRFVYNGAGYKDNLGNVYTEGYVIPVWNNTLTDETITFAIDQKYMNIKGTIALDSRDNSIGDGIWLEFYGDGHLIGKTDHLYAGIRPLDFDMDISNVNDLQIVKKGGGATGNILTEGFFLTD